MFRNLYARDCIIGPSIDIWSNIPWSTFDIVGVEDPAIRKFYEDAFSWYSQDLLAQISREFLVLGRFAASLIYDDRKGYWTGFMPHDPDFLEITPIPVYGEEPKLDLVLSPGMRRWLSSEDDRDVRARMKIPPHMLETLVGSGRVPLDTLNTLFLARKCSPYDYVGTPLATRCVPYWAIEKALMDAMTIAARRRAGNILHAQAGIDNLWEPTGDELNMISSLFVQADEDPTGAVVVTRSGVQVQEVRQGGQIWKLSDEFEFLTKAKMRALGINDAFLDGQATYANLEQAKSIFVEQIVQFRNTMTHQIFGRKAEILARAHGFRRIPQAQLDHRIRIKGPEDHATPEELRRRIKLKNLPFNEAFKIPQEDLITPIMHWHKELKPNQDDKFIDMMEKLEEKLGFKLPIRLWTAATGVSIEDILNMMPEDKKLRERIAAFSGGGGEAAPEESAGPKGGGKPQTNIEKELSSFPEASVKLKALPVWNQDKFLSLPQSEALGCYDRLLGFKDEIRRDPGVLREVVASTFGTDSEKRDCMNYLLIRTGVASGLPVADSSLKLIARTIAAADISAVQMTQELMVLGKLAPREDQVAPAKPNYDGRAEDAVRRVEDHVGANGNEVTSHLLNGFRQELRVAPTSPSLLSGVQSPFIPAPV